MAVAGAKWDRLLEVTERVDCTSELLHECVDGLRKLLPVWEFQPAAYQSGFHDIANILIRTAELARSAGDNAGALSHYRKFLQRGLLPAEPAWLIRRAGCLEAIFQIHAASLTGDLETDDALRMFRDFIADYSNFCALRAGDLNLEDETLLGLCEKFRRGLHHDGKDKLSARKQELSIVDAAGTVFRYTEWALRQWSVFEQRLQSDSILRTLPVDMERLSRDRIRSVLVTLPVRKETQQE